MGRTNILVVDDSDRWRSVARSILENIPSFRVVGEARDGLEAIKKAAALVPDVVLLDVGMPHLNGIEAAKKIRQACASSIIIFLTQESDSDVRRAALATGAFAYVLKPSAGHELRTVVEMATLTAHQTARSEFSVSETSSSV
ncbi:MAG TPA: response regulator transcription factor [Candidatus Sulfotelmatobacter sp.]|jgi:DNA-binding NarL/FixJ family response regulator|nr:response regulator transcription factor [Candidatus Sulfotelmatobacter sp.]